MTFRRGRTLLLVVALFSAQAGAASITYTATQLTGATWRYDYHVASDGADGAIRLFDIEFDPALYDEDSLAIVSAPATAAAWDELILASGIAVPAAYDALALGSGVAPGESAGGFAVSFTWLGEGTPGTQPFQIYDADSFELVDSGTTSAVPLPAGAWLFAAGLAAAGLRARARGRMGQMPC